MRQTRFTEAQIVVVLQEADANGVAMGNVRSRHGLSEQTFNRWRRRYGSMQVDEVERPRELEVENAHLKRLLAESRLEIDAIRDKAPKTSPQAIRDKYGVHPVVNCPDINVAHAMNDAVNAISATGDSAAVHLKQCLYVLASQVRAEKLRA